MPSTKFHPDMTFGNFRQDEYNSLAFEAAQSLAHGRHDLKTLYIHGRSYQGKTHLLHAIGNVAAGSVRYANMYDFMLKWMKAIQRDRKGQFIEKWRSPDVLLLDNIELLAGRNGAQDEIAYLLEHHIISGHTVALAGRVAPGEITGIEPGLFSRLTSGLVVPI